MVGIMTKEQLLASYIIQQWRTSRRGTRIPARNAILTTCLDTHGYLLVGLKNYPKLAMVG